MVADLEAAVRGRCGFTGPVSIAVSIPQRPLGCHLSSRSVYGHHLLDLNRLYGLA